MTLGYSSDGESERLIIVRSLVQIQLSQPSLFAGSTPGESTRLLTENEIGSSPILRAKFDESGRSPHCIEKLEWVVDPAHQALWSVRISVSTLAFQAGKRGSTPLRSTKFARMN